MKLIFLGQVVKINLRKSQLDLFGGGNKGGKDKKVQKPGSRGGKYWIDKHGNVIYGQRPGAKIVQKEQQLIANLKQQKRDKDKIFYDFKVIENVENITAERLQSELDYLTTQYNKFIAENKNPKVLESTKKTFEKYKKLFEGEIKKKKAVSKSKEKVKKPIIEKVERIPEQTNQDASDTINDLYSKYAKEQKEKAQDYSTKEKDKIKKIAGMNGEQLEEKFPWLNVKIFSDSEQNDFNRFTHYPQDLNQDYLKVRSELLGSTLSKVEEQGFKNIPNDVGAEINNYLTEYRNYINSIGRARNVAPPWSVVGRSNYKGNRDKANSIEQKAKDTFDSAKKRLDTAIKNLSVETKARISSDEPDAVKQLREKVDALTKKQDRMKQVNNLFKKLVKEHGKATAIKNLMPLLGDEESKEVLIHFKFGDADRPYPDYKLQNNNQTINNAKKRIEELTKKQSDKTKKWDFPDKGIEIIDNVEDNRLQIKFDKIPSQEVRSKLKSNGFKWSPTNSAWQRFRGVNANFYAEKIFGVELK